MKKICMYLGYVTFILGIIGSFVVAKYSGVEIAIGHFSQDIELSRNWLLTIIYFFLGLLLTSIFSSVLLGLSEILTYLESLSDTNELIENNILDKDSSANALKSGYWKCPKCGNMNPPYTGTCSCGGEKP